LTPNSGLLIPLVCTDGLNSLSEIQDLLDLQRIQNILPRYGRAIYQRCYDIGEKTNMLNHDKKNWSEVDSKPIETHHDNQYKGNASTKSTSNKSAGVYGSICSEKSVKAVHKVTQQQKPDWWDIVNRIDQLEECLGHRAGLSDLYNARSSNEEIGIVKELMPSLFKSESEIMEECSDLKSGRIQEGFYTYGFKILASESSLDNSKARGFLDRCFEIPCLVGKPEYNIKKISEKQKSYARLRDEVERTRKLLFACRMLYHGEIIEEVGLSIFNREAELTEHLIRLFLHSPNTLEKLRPALIKVLDVKRKVKSDSLEAVIYRAICNLTNITDSNKNR
jgi:hypothetical protein